MPFELFDPLMSLPRFALIASRIGGMVMFIPGLASAAVPANIRVLFVLALALLLTPVVSLPADAPDTVLELLLALAMEFLLGALLGLVAIACFIGLQMGALLVAQEAGLAYGQIVDPTSEEQESVLGVLYVQIGFAIFLVVGGHRALVQAALDSLRTLPLMHVNLSLDAAVNVLAQALLVGAEVGLRVAGPALLTMLLVNVALGFVSRTMPQLNILAVGFSIKSLVAFVILAVSLPAAAGAFIDALERTRQWIGALVGG